MECIKFPVPGKTQLWHVCSSTDPMHVSHVQYSSRANHIQVSHLSHMWTQPSTIFFLTCQLHTSQLIYDDQPLLSEDCSLGSDIPYFLICCSIPSPNCHNSFSHAKISTNKNTVVITLNKNHFCNNNGSKDFSSFLYYFFGAECMGSPLRYRQHSNQAVLNEL
jgi:hypothetical protein